MSRRRVALGLLAGLACFGLSLVRRASSGGLGRPGAPAAEPRIVLDPGSVVLLPDASLHLDLRGFDAGTRP